MAHDPISTNPFYVLEVRPGASSTEIEREGQKLLAMLEVGLRGADVYPTPLGGMPRDADLVRRSLDALRDPARASLHAIWAALDPSVEATLRRDEPEDDVLIWPGAWTALGWRTP